MFEFNEYWLILFGLIGVCVCMGRMGAGKLKAPPGQIVKLIVGLGNYGFIFNNTRHNVGKTCVNYLIKCLNIQTESIRGGDIAFLRKDNSYVAFFIPSTFMNLSGGPTKQALEFCKIKNVKDMIVLHDDLDSALGKLKIKEAGSAEGHNGLKSIIQNLGGENGFPRLKIGIGRPDSKDSEVVAKYVTSKFLEAEQKTLDSKVFLECLTLLRSRDFL